METMEAAKKEGKIRYIGFSVHSQETAVAAMDRYPFDTVLFPVNFVLFSQAKFGPQILEKAQEKKMGILALKGMAKTTWPAAEKKNHPEPKCWYRPAAYPNEAALGLRWTLGHPITAALPPGEEKYFRLAMDVAFRRAIGFAEQAVARVPRQRRLARESPRYFAQAMRKPSSIEFAFPLVIHRTLDLYNTNQ